MQYSSQLADIVPPPTAATILFSVQWTVHCIAINAQYSFSSLVIHPLLYSLCLSPWTRSECLAL